MSRELTDDEVLILVVVDDCLVLLGLEKMLKQDVVLILVVVDDSLVPAIQAALNGKATES